MGPCLVVLYQPEGSSSFFFGPRAGSVGLGRPCVSPRGLCVGLRGTSVRLSSVSLALCWPERITCRPGGTYEGTERVLRETEGTLYWSYGPYLT